MSGALAVVKAMSRMLHGMFLFCDWTFLNQLDLGKLHLICPVFHVFNLIPFEHECSGFSQATLSRVCAILTTRLWFS